MKTNFDNSGAITPINQKRRGAALILVLSFLVLITALVIAFFTSVTTELSGAKQYAGGATAKQLADSAVQTVMGTIKLATSGTTDAGLTTAWASQPGMIRTYDTNGDPVAYYKLYSSGTMVIPKVGISSFDLASDRDETSATSNWSTKPALYTDLNSPLASGTGFIFPIVDGNNLTNGSQLTPKVPLIKPDAAKTYLTYYSNKFHIPDMEGFYVEQPEFTYKNTIPVSSANNPVPMPTKWIYVLRDGTLTAPDPESTTVATFRNAPTAKQPTTDNPITGRIAFWTDDETCKVNINTASAGSYWDIPRAAGKEEVAFARKQPLNKEYQRYPGHPSTTSLKPVFSKTWYGQDTTAINEQIYQIAPRVTGGGSKSGTVVTTGSTYAYGLPITLDNDRLYAAIDELMFTPALSSSGTSRVPQTLTASQLEKSRFFITANNRAPDVNLFNKPRVCIWPISSGTSNAYRTTYDNMFAFCSTSGSNPATGSGNIYYFQRSDADSPTTDLPTSGSSSGLGRNRMLMEYLRDMTKKKIPGFGGDFLGFHAKYFAENPEGGTDCDQILTEIFDYIRCVNLSDGNLALATGSAATAKPYTPKDAAGTGQVVPIQDTTNGTRGFGRFPTVGKAFFMFIGNAQNPPFTLPPASGTFVLPKFTALADGSFLQNDLVVTSASTTWVTPTLAEMKPYTTKVTGTTGGPTGVLHGRIRVQAGFFIEPFCPSHGQINIWPKFTVQVDGLDKITWGPANTGTSAATFPTGATDGSPATVTGTLSVVQRLTGIVTGTAGRFMTPPRSPVPDWSIAKISMFPGGYMGFISMVLGKGVDNTFAHTSGTTGAYQYWTSTYTTTTVTQTNGTSNYTVETNDPLASSNSTIPAFYFSGGKVTVTIRNMAGTVVQTVTLDFPGGNFPVPMLAPTNPIEGQVGHASYDALGNFRYFVTGSTTTLAYKNATNAAARIGEPARGGRLNSAGDGNTGIQAPCAWIINTDVVRSLETPSGDVRMVAAQTKPDVSLFTPHKNYKTAERMAHSLRGTRNNPYYGATVGRLVPLPLASLPSGNVYGPSGNICNMVTGQWSLYRYTNNGNYYDPGNPSTTGTGIYVGGGSDPRKLKGDWDNGCGNFPDGPYINRADEGDGNKGGNVAPYYETYEKYQYDPEAILFSPNRQIASAAMFGSLSTGVIANSPWQTLLFRPLPIGHPGLGTSTTGAGDAGPPYSMAPDHLLLDLFNMPVVEPYPISEPLSTAGRINMNYQIAPFTSINRDTGIRAVLDSERVISIADSDSTLYKSGTNSMSSCRLPINMEETLNDFTKRFKKKDIFRSASEICSINLVPVDPADINATSLTMAAYWSKHQPTGDNSRERPYATIYPRLTTKSNTYTVHFRVQTLKKTKGTAATAATWDEKKDTVVGEYRGSQTIERYVDASDPSIPDYANPSDPDVNKPIDQFYKFRVIGTKNFTP